MIKLDIWSDIACPFCYIGKRNLERAIAHVGMQQDIRIQWRSFQLDPNAPREDDRTLFEILSAKYQMGEEEVRSMTEDVSQTASKAGLTMNMENVQPANTFDAHRLLHFAAEHGNQHRMKESLFNAYFSDGRNIADTSVLLDLAEKVELDKAAVFDALDSGAYAKEVREDISEAKKLGIQGVPFFLLNKKYGLSGAQPVETFVKVLEQIKDPESVQAG